MSDRHPFRSEDSESGLESNTGDLGASFKKDLADFFDDLLTYRMPFGRFKQSCLDDLPFEYLHWFVERGGGFPAGRLGELMEFVYQTKSVGAESVFAELKKRRKRGRL